MFPHVPWMIADMEQEPLERLGKLVVARRKGQGWATREQFASNIDLTYRVLTDLENGKRQLGPKAYATIERALDWKPGSVDRILAGGDPMPEDALISNADMERALAVAQKIVDAPATPHDEYFRRAERLLSHAHESTQQADYLGAIHGLEGVESTIELLLHRLTESAAAVANREKDRHADQPTTAATPAAPTGAPGAKDKKNRAADGRKDNVRDLKRPNQDADVDPPLPPLDQLAAESGGPKGIETGPAPDEDPEPDPNPEGEAP